MCERDREWGVLVEKGERGVEVRGRWRSKGLRKRNREEAIGGEKGMEIMRVRGLGRIREVRDKGGIFEKWVGVG